MAGSTVDNNHTVLRDVMKAKTYVILLKTAIVC